MALSTLSPPSFITYSLLPDLHHHHHHHHPSAVAPSRTNYHNSSLSTVHKWRASVSFFTGLLNNKKAKNAEAIKQELLEAIEPLDRGAEATPQYQKFIDQIARKLEAANPTQEPLKSDLLKRNQTNLSIGCSAKR